MIQSQIISNIEIAIRAALLVGIEIMKVYESTDFNIQTKTDNSPVTKADLLSSSIICNILESTKIPIICEELEIPSFEIRKKWDVLWLIDPLDGTKDFIMQNGEFTVNIALIENNSPIAGIIYLPAQNILYFGSPFLGSFVIHEVSTRIDSLQYTDILKSAKSLPLLSERGDFIIVKSRSYLDDATKNYIESIIDNNPKATSIELGSSLKFVSVASGMADLYPRLSQISEWDIAAGDAIAQGAGCTMIDISTQKPIIYNTEKVKAPCFILSR